MTCKQLVALGVRLFCVWFAIYLMTGMTSYWIAISRQPHNESAGTILLAAIAVFALIVVLLWLFPLTVARNLLPRSALDQSIAVPPHEQIERAGFCLMGLWLLTHALPGLVFDAVITHLYHYPGATMELRPQDYAAVAEHLVELVLALWLLFGARGLRGLLAWTHSAGSPSARVDSNPEE